MVEGLDVRIWDIKKKNCVDQCIDPLEFVPGVSLLLRKVPLKNHPMTFVPKTFNSCEHINHLLLLNEQFQCVNHFRNHVQIHFMSVSEM